MRSRILARDSSAADGFDGAEECADEDEGDEDDEEDEDANLEIGVPGAASGLGAGLPGRAGCFPFAAGADFEEWASLALPGGAAGAITLRREWMGQPVDPLAAQAAGSPSRRASGT